MAGVEGDEKGGGGADVRTVALSDGRILVPLRSGYEIAQVGAVCTCGENVDYGCARHFPLTRLVYEFADSKTVLATTVLEGECPGPESNLRPSA